MSVRELRPCDAAILEALADGPLSAREVADRIRLKAWAEWAERNGYEIEWETEAEPLGARLLASVEARGAGLKLHGWEVQPRLCSLERRGEVQRIQLDGHRSMLWRLP